MKTYYEIGEISEIDGKKYKVEIGERHCKECAFYRNFNCIKHNLSCCQKDREDKQWVIFKEVKQNDKFQTNKI